MPATELAARIRSKELSAVEAMTAFLDRIDAVNPRVNAIVSMISREQALAMARAADADLASGKPVGPLHGMPWAVKDMEDCKGFVTSRGSPAFKDIVAEEDSVMVARLRAAGALMIGKTNVPELGAGSNTFNPVFGATRNPYNLAMTAGGSTGGGAAALAAGMLPITDGSDTGGSCRNPGSWNNVVGFRTSMGRFPMEFATSFYLRLPVLGPMARDVQDAAFALSVMAGPSDRDPISLQEDPALFLKPLGRDFQGTRIAWTPNLGYLEVDTQIVSTTQKSVPILERIGCRVDNAHPDMPGVFETNKTLRSAMYASAAMDFPESVRSMFKGAVQWEISEGSKLSALDIATAEAQRAKIFQNVSRFMETYEFLVLPVTQVPPFPVEQEYPREINGKPMRSYLEWMEIVYAITLTGLPAISVPCGFTPTGLPVGLQIVGRRGRDFDVLQLAHAFEQAVKVPQPIVPAT
jgi:amidase